jgi:hypothetical protein
MVRDNSPQVRQRQNLERKLRKKRAECDRVLIVSEGSKTEPNYFEDIRIDLRLPTANIAVMPSGYGTEPKQIVEYAKLVFEKGDVYKGIEPKVFDHIYVVFDRDEHRTYFNALNFAGTLDGKLKNDERKPVSFKAIASVPNFELWLLLHYENILAPISRDEALQRLKKHLPWYEKGAMGVYKATCDLLGVASGRAQSLAMNNNARTAPDPFTAIWELVSFLKSLRR